jgi:hypothetical protein
VSSRSAQRRGSPPPAVARELKRAGALFGSFREQNVGQLKRRAIDWPSVSVAIGRVLAIEYETTHGGRRKRYRHDFKAWARPPFESSADGRLLLILPGNFVFTARGIVDTRRPGGRRSRSQ